MEQEAVHPAALHMAAIDRITGTDMGMRTAGGVKVAGFMPARGP